MGDHAQVEFHGQSQVGLVGARLDDLRHRRQIDGGDEEPVRIVHIGLVASCTPLFGDVSTTTSEATIGIAKGSRIGQE
jgi:hypothetical protein